MIKFQSLTNQITAFFIFLTTIYFMINLLLTILYINEEKREDLQLLLAHAIDEAYYYIGNNTSRDNIENLYRLHSVASVLGKSGARDILFFITKDQYVPTRHEISASKQLSNGLYLNLKSTDVEVKNHIYQTIKKMFLQHFAYLIIVGILGIYFIHKMLVPLNHLSNQCKNYKGNHRFYLNNKNLGNEIRQIESALNMLVNQFEELRHKDKEFFTRATHELKTPLAILKARIEKFKQSDSYSKQLFINDANDDIKRLYLEIQSMLYFNIFDFNQKQEFSVTNAINAAIESVDLLIKSRKLNVHISGEDFSLYTRLNLFSKMFMSVFENAIAYAREKSTIMISLYNKTISIKNTQGGEINLFSSKLGTKILEKLCNELNFTFKIIKDDKYYEVLINFN